MQEPAPRARPAGWRLEAVGWYPAPVLLVSDDETPMSSFPASWPMPERQPFAGLYCRLEPLDPALHGNDLYAVASDRDAERLYRWLPDPMPTSRRAFEEELLAAAAAVDRMAFAVIDGATGRAEGRQSLMDISTAHGSAEIGHILWGPRIAGTRVATEAFFLLADHVFDLGYRRYQWRCNARNGPSRRAAERFGYAFEGIFRQHLVLKGESRDTAWYSILDHEWPDRRTAFARWLDPENFDEAGRQRRRLSEFRPAS